MKIEASKPDADPGTERSFEELLTELLAGFINVRAEAVDEAIENAQQHICEALGLDRSTLFQFKEPPGEFTITHCWGKPECKLNPVGVAGALYPWGIQQILAGRRIQFSSVEELPPEAGVDKETIRRLGPKSSLILPLGAEGKVLGAIGFGAMRAEREWPELLVVRLQYIAEIFTSVLSRKAAAAALCQAQEEMRLLKQKLQQENAYLRREVSDFRGEKRIIGKSPALQRVLIGIEQVAATNSTVLVQGETGTGKELIATAIHQLSQRAGRAMVTANLAAIPATLMESELFGREKGAYTGALTRQAGCFELASGSTIFLDEISELPPDMQVKLLRVLQEKQIQRLGGQKPLGVDIRVIAATNRDLLKLVHEGKFREALLLSPERISNQGAGLAGKARRYPAAGLGVRGRIRRATWETDQDDWRRDHGATSELFMARQYPRAAERHRAGDDHFDGINLKSRTAGRERGGASAEPGNQPGGTGAYPAGAEANRLADPGRTGRRRCWISSRRPWNSELQNSASAALENWRNRGIPILTTDYTERTAG